MRYGIGDVRLEWRQVNRAMRYAATAFAVLAAVVVFAVLVADRRYQFLFAAPKVSHETVLGPSTRMRAVVQPPLAEPLVLGLLGASPPPPWVLGRVMPYEAAIVASPDTTAGRLGVTLFLNSQRLTPLIATAADEYGIPRKAPYIAWDAPAFDRSKRGVLSMTGSMPIDEQTVAAVHDQWGIVQLPGLPPLEGNHAAEVSIDNRDGSLYTVLSAFANQGLLALPMPLESLRKTIAPVATLSLTADPDGGDALAFRLRIECQPTAEPGQVTGVSFAIAGIYGELVKLVERRGATLSGEKRTEDQSIIGEYRLAPVSALVRVR